jgi:hypothetical protein
MMGFHIMDVLCGQEQFAAMVKVCYGSVKKGYRDCPERWYWLKVVAVDRSFLKREVPRYSVHFDHPFSFEMPF